MLLGWASLLLGGGGSCIQLLHLGGKRWHHIREAWVQEPQEEVLF